MNLKSKAYIIVGRISDWNLQIFLIGWNFQILHFNVLIFIFCPEAHFFCQKRVLGRVSSWPPFWSRPPKGQFLKFYKYGHIVYRWKAYSKLINIKIGHMGLKPTTNILRAFKGEELWQKKLLFHEKSTTNWIVTVNPRSSAQQALLKACVKLNHIYIIR